MEAAVLKPAIMPEVDCNSNTLNAELEVKKLQELVRKLERQNEQLRTRASGVSGGPHAASPSPALKGYCRPSLLCQSSLGSFASSEEPFQYFHPHSGGDGAAAAGEEEEEEDESEPSVLDELELLDLESLSCSDQSDETWLYASPKAAESPEDSMTPLLWCRKALDSPKSEVEAARRSLSLRLEQVSRWRSTLSSPSTSSSPGPPPPPPLSRVAGVSPISAPSPAKPCSTPQMDRHAAPLSSPLHPVLHRTLSPVGKELSPVAERTPTFFPHSRSRSLRRSAFSPQSSMEGDLMGSEPEDDSIALGYKLQDLTDVQVMARLQEENLRAHRYFSFINPRRSKTGPRQHVVLPSQPPQPELHLPAQPAQRRTRPGGGRRGGRRRLRPPAAAAAAPHPPAPLPHLLQHPRLAKKHKFPVHPSFHPLHPAIPFRWVRVSGAAATTGVAAGTRVGTGQPVRSRVTVLPTRISWPMCFGETSSWRAAEYENKLRRSMPNLVRTPSMPSVPLPTNPSASPALLRNSQSFDSSSGLARLQSSIPSPGQPIRVQSVGNFTSLSRPQFKATAYVSPTIKGSSPMPTSTSLQSLNGSSSSLGSNSGIPLLNKQPAPASTPTTPRSGLPRPASFVGTPSSTPRSKMAQPARSLLTPPKSLSTLSALRDSAWRDGCY
ncbi:SLAIN motif-containing protein 1-like isoform X1 [Halichoeres trimaculatus]|uniref:SLAIN motif-containing protein 1-like isoform X1 n=1 Tax=Halichoeres trimaculatus TaxID=147232 RepID=UPI003D9F6D81